MTEPYAPTGGTQPGSSWPPASQPGSSWPPASQPSSPWPQAPQPSSYAPIPQSDQVYGHPVYGPPSYPAPSAPGAAAWYPGMPRTDYARWAKRVGAYLIDHLPGLIGLIIFYIGYFRWLVAIMNSGGETVPFGTGGVAMIVGAALTLAGLGWNVYNRWIVAGRTGQSLGKRVTKITLLSEQTDQPIGAMNAFLRDLVHILDGAAYVGYLWPLWDDKRQTFADKIMRTIVIDVIATAPAPPPPGQIAG